MRGFAAKGAPSVALKGVAVAFYAALLAGCASLRSEPPSISRAEWNALTTEIASGPAELSQWVALDADQRVRDELAASGVDSLSSFISSSRNEGLRPDEAFERLLRVAEGKKAKPRDAFGRAYAAALHEPAFADGNPLYARYLSDRYGVAWPEPAMDAVPFFVVDHDRGGEWVWVKPSRVKAIHLVYAGKGTTAASRFGHIAVRLVVAPDDSADLAEASRALDEHLYLGFQAYINELEMSLPKGVLGGYSAYLFAERFMDAYQRYAVEEFRSLRSVPLRLTRSERERATRELADIHWRFQAPYTYFNDNCSALMQDALRVVMPRGVSERIMARDYQRPDWFFRAMCETDLVDASVLEDPRVAERDGYFFPSTKLYYEKALRVVDQHRSGEPFEDLDTYTDRAPMARVSEVVEDEAYVGALAGNAYVLDAQILLEQLAFQRHERRVRKALVDYMVNVDWLSPEAVRAADWDTESQAIYLNLLERARLARSGAPRRHAGIPRERTAGTPELQPRPRDAAERDRLTRTLDRAHPEKRERWRAVLAHAALAEDALLNMNLLEELRNDQSLSKR